MNSKILFWISEELIYYCIANALQKKIDGDFYCIVESHNGVKKFFEQQDFVKFKKIWHLYDNVKIKDSIDYEYLKNFEKKYNINIWDLGFSERIFYPDYNKFHKFSYKEILSIIEQQCKLFELVLDEIKPEILLIGVVTRLPTYIIYKLCKLKNIKVLTLESAKFGSRFTLSQQIDRIDNPENFKQVQNKNRTVEQLNDYLTHYAPYISPYTGSSISKNFKNSKLKKLQAIIEFTFLPIDQNYKTQYIHLGKNKSKLLTQGTNFILSLKRSNRERFLNKYCIRKFDKSEPFIYFPLHYEPERELLIQAPTYSNQLSLIYNIARSIPVGYMLYVKDHPRMEDNGWRKTDYYQSILNLPNVKLIHPSIKASEVYSHCSLIVTLLGTAGLEASFYGKPSVVLEDTDYSVLPWVHKSENLKSLPETIKTALNSTVDNSALDTYTEFVDQNSFEFDKTSYWFQFNERFPYIGFLQELKIPTNEIKIFLDDTSEIFEKISDEYARKIKTTLKN